MQCLPRSTGPCLMRASMRAGQQLRLVVPRAAYSTSHFTTEYTLSTEDRLEIIDLCHKFDRALNLGQQDKLGAFFVPEAQVTTPLSTVQGVGAILAYFEKCKPIAAGNRHVTCNVIVEPDGLNAAKVSAYRLLHKCCSPPVLLASGLIEDRLVNTNGTWLFSQRTFIMDPPAQQQQQQQPAAGSNGSNN